MSWLSPPTPVLSIDAKGASALSPRRVPQISARRAHLAKVKGLEARKCAENGFSAIIPIALRTPPYSPVWSSEHFRQPEPTQLDKSLLRLHLHGAQKTVRELQAIFDLPRVTSSEACQDLIEFVMRTNDTMVPSVHGKATAAERELLQSGGCCNIL